MERATVLYDGGCGLCQRSVAFARARDRHRRLAFVAAQSPEGHALLTRHGLLATAHNTLVVIGPGRHVRSDAVVRLLRALPARWRLVAVLVWLVPQPIRDAAYRFVAARRHRAA